MVEWSTYILNYGIKAMMIERNPKHLLQLHNNLFGRVLLHFILVDLIQVWEWKRSFIVFEDLFNSSFNVFFLSIHPIYVCMNEHFVIIIFGRLFILIMEERVKNHSTKYSSLQFLPFDCRRFLFKRLNVSSNVFFCPISTTLSLRETLADHILWQSFIEKEKLLLMKWIQARDQMNRKTISLCLLQNCDKCPQEMGKVNKLWHLTWKKQNHFYRMRKYQNAFGEYKHTFLWKSIQLLDSSLKRKNYANGRNQSLRQHMQWSMNSLDLEI